MGTHLEPQDMKTLIRELAERQDALIRQQRQKIEVFRSIFGRLHSLARDGYFTFEEVAGEWISARSVMDVLQVGDNLVNGSDIDNVADGISRVGSGTDDIFVVRVPSQGHPLDS